MNYGNRSIPNLYIWMYNVDLYQSFHLDTVLSPRYGLSVSSTVVYVLYFY